MERACSLVTAVRFLTAKNGVDYKFSLHFLPGLWYTCLRNKCHAISTVCLQLRESVGYRYRRCVLCSYLEEALTHTVTHTTKRVDGNSGEDRAYLPQYTELKASKSLKKQQAECPDTLRNQQVRCSSHPTSSKKHRKLRFSVLFCCKNAENGVSQNAGQLLTHTVTYTRKCADRFKEYRRGNRFLSGALLACGSYRICAMKLPIFSAAFCCICRVAWV